MKKLLYLVLSVLSIVYIGFLIVGVVKSQTGWNPDMGKFEKVFDFIVNFGGVTIIFCFALINFAGNPLKIVFFVLLIVAILVYFIVLIIPDTVYSWFSFINPAA